MSTPTPLPSAMAVTLKSLKNPAVYIVVAVLAIIMLADFSQRVWQPLHVRDSNLSDLTAADLFANTTLAYPAALTDWLQQHEQEQHNEGSTGLQNEQEQITAMPGSTAFDSANIRIRAIFITPTGLAHSPASTQALAIAELQNRTNGELSRAVWRIGDLVSGWLVYKVEPKRVVLTSPAQEQQGHEQQKYIELYVFEPSQATPVALEVDSETK